MEGRVPKRRRLDWGVMLGGHHGRSPEPGSLHCPSLPGVGRQEALAYCNFWDSYFAYLASGDPNHIGWKSNEEMHGKEDLQNKTLCKELLASSLAFISSHPSAQGY